MQLSAIKSNILDNCGLASTDPRFPTATLDRIVNRALRKVASEHDWPWNEVTTTVATVLDTKTTAMPAGLNKVIAMAILGRDLVPLQPREGVTLTTDSGRPYGYWVEGDVFHWAPLPDGVYTVDLAYHGIEAPLGSVAGGTDDTDTPNLPDQYIDFLIAHASMMIASQIRDTDLYGMADNERNDWLRRMNDDVRRVASPQKIKTRRDWWI